jgi:uncharacterized integral membrane protein
VKRLHWLITVPLALFLIVFAVNNRHLVDVSLWPLDFIVRWPLFIFVYIGVVAGFLAGAVIAWASAAQRHRRTRRRRLDKGAQTVEVAPAKDQRETSDGAGRSPPALVD